MIVGDRLGDTCSLGEARTGEPIRSLFSDHASRKPEELAMPFLVRRRTAGLDLSDFFLSILTEPTHRNFVPSFVTIFGHSPRRW